MRVGTEDASRRDGRPDPERVADVLEAVLAGADGAVETTALTGPCGTDADGVVDGLRALADRCGGTGLELVSGPGGWSLVTREEDSWLARTVLGEERTTPATLEVATTLYVFGPMTRHDVERVRGSSLSPEIVKRLIERGWIGIVGRRDGPGRPLLWDVRDPFLRAYGLSAREGGEGRARAVEEGLAPLPPPRREASGDTVDPE